MRDEAEHKADSEAVEVGARRCRDAEGVITIRAAGEGDEAVLRELWEEFEAEVPPPPEDVETWDQEWADVSADLNGRGAVFVAEDDDGVVAQVRGRMLDGNVWYVASAYVRPLARRRGLLKALMRELVQAGR